MHRRQFLASTLPLFALTGCMSDYFGKKSTTSRSRIGEGDTWGPVRTVGDWTIFDGARDLPVSGVGLVIGLPGTGGGSPTGDFRTKLEDQLKKKGFDNARKMIDHPDHAMVFVSALIPPGCRRNDPVDLEVTIPQGSRTRSIRGGFLTETTLYNYDTDANIQSVLQQNNVPTSDRASGGLRLGSPLVRGEGVLNPVIEAKRVARSVARGKASGLETEIDPADRRGFVWDGGRTAVDRPYYIIMNPEYQRVQVTMALARRINETFHGPLGTSDKIAIEKDNEKLVLGIPAQYRLNIPHYQRVVRAIPVEPLESYPDYRSQLESQLASPSTCIVAALRLEALGQEGVATLRGALTSTYPLVRFAAAEALGYLGQSVAAEELAKLAKEHPVLQAYALTALAAMDEAAASDRLEVLMATDKPEVRYGAFRALWMQDRSASVVRPQALGRAWGGREPSSVDPLSVKAVAPTLSWFLHEVAPESTPMVHAVSGKRAEVVVFGKATLRAPFTLLVGDSYTVACKPGDTEATISCFGRGDKVVQKTGLSVADVVRGFGKLEASYAVVVAFLQQADETKALACSFKMDALPKGVTVGELADLGRNDPKMDFATQAEMIKQSSGDLGVTPSLFTASATK